MADLGTPVRDENYTATGPALGASIALEQKRSLVELRHQPSSLGNPWVVARDEIGPTIRPFGRGTARLPD
jgi:hypothetical protein